MRLDVNLGSDERASRLRAALMTLGFVLVLMIVLAELSLGVPWWSTLALPLFGVSTLIVQAYTGVCPSHASKGTRATADGAEQVLDPQQRCALEARGRVVMLSSIAIWLAATAIVLALAAIR